MKNPFKKKSSDWATHGRNDKGSWIQTDSSQNVREIKSDGTVITYDKNGNILSRTGGTSNNSGPGSSNDNAPNHNPVIAKPPVVDQIKADEQRSTNVTQVSLGGSSGAPIVASDTPAPLSTATPKAKVEFKTADNGDLLQRAEGGNWYVAKDNPDQANDVISRSEGLNKKYGLGEYASPTASDALASRSEAMNKEHKLGEYASDKSDHTESAAVDARSLAMNKEHKLGDYAKEKTDSASQTGLEAKSEALNEKYGLGAPPLNSSGPAWHANPNWEAVNDTSKNAISQAAPSVNTDDVLELRSGANNNVLLRMKDGTYKSVDLTNGNVSGAGTWNNSQWADSQYATEAPSASVAAASEPVPAAPAQQQYTSSPAPEEVEYTNLARQWASGHNSEAQNVTESHSTPSDSTGSPESTPANSYSPANQYSSDVDMAQIQRDLAAINVEPAPFTLPGTPEADLSGAGGFDASEAVPPANRMNIRGAGHHFE